MLIYQMSQICHIIIGKRAVNRNSVVTEIVYVTGSSTVAESSVTRTSTELSEIVKIYLIQHYLVLKQKTCTFTRTSLITEIVHVYQNQYYSRNSAHSQEPAL